MNLNKLTFNDVDGSSKNASTSRILKPSCSLFDKSFQQFYADIDNLKYPQFLTLSQNRTINFSCLNKSSPTKTILYWNTFFGDNSYGYGLGKVQPFVKMNCPVTNCEATFDKSRLNDSQAVLVHMRDSFEMPKFRKPDQKWMFLLYESQVHSSDFTHLNNFFNETVTFILDSDYPGAYETGSLITWRANPSFNERKDFLSEKKEFAVAVISNCGDNSKRLVFIKALQKHIPIDVFGRCGKPCPHSQNCKGKIAATYKFYFGFENSVCKDYVTEKFFQILQHDIIPVVYGGGSYENYIPKSGFVNVRDFNSPKKLADYLNYLSNNKTAYNSYFKWKKYVTFDSKLKSHSPICDICIKLHLEHFFGLERKIIHDLGGFWNRKKDCVHPDEISKTFFNSEL